MTFFQSDFDSDSAWLKEWREDWQRRQKGRKMNTRKEIREKCEQIILADQGTNPLTRKLARDILSQLEAYGPNNLWSVLALKALDPIISEMNATYPQPADLDALRAEMQEWIASCDGRTILMLSHIITAAFVLFFACLLIFNERRRRQRIRELQEYGHETKRRLDELKITIDKLETELSKWHPEV